MLSETQRAALAFLDGAGHSTVRAVSGHLRLSGRSTRRTLDSLYRRSLVTLWVPQGRERYVVTDRGRAALARLRP